MVEFNVLENHKDALLALLYTQVNFLKNEIEEKNILIRTLIIKDHEVYDDSDTNSIRSTSEYITTSEYEANSDDDNDAFIDDPAEVTEISVNYEIVEDSNDDELFFHLHQQYEDFMRNENEIEIERQRNMENQLINIRSMKHNEFIRMTTGGEDINMKRNEFIDRGIKPSAQMKDVVKDSNNIWPQNTCLIVGDSILNNLEESKLTKKNRIVKVRAFPGANIDDMYSYIIPLIRKKPTYIIMHIGTNDAAYKSADEILTEILQLKTFIKKHLPSCNIALSQPIIRNDSTKAKETIRNLINKLDLLNIQMVDNRNIELEQLGRKGLHLNKWGTSKLAMNYISFIHGF